MKRAPTAIGILLALALVATACTPQSESSTTTVSRQDTTTSTLKPVATTQAVSTTTTTTLPLATVELVGDVPTDIAAVVGGFLTVVQDPRNDASLLEPEMVTHFSDAAGTLEDTYTGTAEIHELDTGGSVGVVTLGVGDLILVADDGDGWHVVGADMSSINADPWFGASPLRILILGSDARPGYTAGVSRMDSIHVLTAVPSQRTGTILGWPRDTWVDTPYGSMRINAITSSGRGPEPLFEHFTDTWEIPLDGYILTAFSGFEKLIATAVGRLIVTIPIYIPEQPWWAAFSSGTQKLTPTRTLDFARTRKKVPGGDFTRSKHQGIIMLAVLTMLQQGDIDDVPVLLGELVKYTDTNLSPTDLIRLGVSAFYMDVASITNEVLPGYLGRSANGASVVFLEPEAEAIIDDVVTDGIRDNG